MLYRYYISIVLVAITLSGAHAERALTRVIDVEQSGANEVVLDAGRLDGLREGARVTLLREGEAIVHPLTGEVLGIPQEPVGLVEVKGLQDRRARAIMVKSYSMPQIGDLAEYGKVPMAVATPSAPAEVAKVMKRVKTLEVGMRQYKKSQKSLSAYPVFAQQVWDEMGTIKSYLVALDERLIELETQQHEDRNRLTAMIGGESQGTLGKELTIRYSEDTDLKLRVAGKTLMISVERDSIRLKEAGMGETKEMSFAEGDLHLDGEEIAEGEEEGWDMSLDGMMDESPYLFAGSLLFIAIIAGVLLVVIKRRYDQVMGGLDEYDQDFLADDDDDEEDFEDFEDEYEKK
ncbi:MAG TPA: hypothetical protein EYG11_20980 [Candidatus Latescibacteria bacterium]|nr:hypothetical protein [Candidatus Handelsmanbacteria bacterium]HIL11178.1 hypothetical protein [Candidatus Latescibacterota bacterium]